MADINLLVSKVNGEIGAIALLVSAALRDAGMWICFRDPAADFLTDAVAVEAALLGLAIPLSFDIISRISERYESDVVTRRFVNEPVVVWLPRCLVLNITLAIVMKFLKGSGAHGSLKWRLVAWLGLIGFLSTGGILFVFLKTLKSYIVNRKFIVDKLIDEARKSIH